MKDFIAAISLLTLFVCSCKKETFITGQDALLSLSADSLRFDTVFTTTGSITQFFRIYNDNDQKLRISSVSLSGGANSPFRMNVDGIANPTVSDIEMESNDSLYVFVTVKIDPTTSDLPFVVLLPSATLSLSVGFFFMFHVLKRKKIFQTKLKEIKMHLQH